MLLDNVIHQRRFEHRPHCYVGLFYGGPLLLRVHVVQNLTTMHRLNILNPHLADNWLNVLNVPFPVVPTSVPSQMRYNILHPKLVPSINRHFRKGYKRRIMIQYVFRDHLKWRYDRIVSVSSSQLRASGIDSKYFSVRLPDFDTNLAEYRPSFRCESPFPSSRPLRFFPILCSSHRMSPIQQFVL